MKSISEIEVLIQRTIKLKWQAERDGKLTAHIEAGLNNSIDLFQATLQELKKKEKMNRKFKPISAS